MSPIRPSRLLSRRRVLSLFAVSLVFAFTSFAGSPVDERVREFLSISAASSQKSPIVVVLKRQPTVANIIKNQRLSGDLEHIKAQAFMLLKQEVDFAQADVRDLCTQLEQSGDAENVGYFFLSNVVMLNASQSAIRQLQAHPGVAQIIGDHDQVFTIDPRDVQVHETAPDPAEKPWGLAFIKATEANEKGHKGKGVIVAVTDTGINLDHPAFAAGQILKDKSKSFAPGEPTAEDGHGHGTHCAGTVVSQLYGVAPEAQVVGVKVLSASGSGSWRSVMEGVEYAAQVAQIVSMSLGGPSTKTGNIVETAVKNAWDAGTFFSIAAGNSGAGSGGKGTIGSPGALDDPLTVGAIGPSGELARFSSHGPSVYGKEKPEITAPGVGVLSAWKKGGTATISGTSMATPHNAGLAALIRSVNKNLPPNEVKKLIMAHGFGKKIPNQTGEGTIDCVASLSEIVRL